MAYTKKTWVSGETPLSAENMNNIEQGIAAAHEDISELNTKFICVYSEALSITVDAGSGNAAAYTLNIPTGYTVLFRVVNGSLSDSWAGEVSVFNSHVYFKNYGTNKNTFTGNVIAWCAKL